MKIAIIGAGNVGAALGAGWVREGHLITYGVRKPDDSKYQKLGRVSTNADAAREAEVIVLSTPWEATETAIRASGDLTGKILIDATNPVRPDFTGLDRGFDTSGAEQVARWAAGAHVFKSMNQVGYGLMNHPQMTDARKPVMFVAGGDYGKSKVLQLVAELGFEAIDVGELQMARMLEPLAWLWIHLAVKKGMGVEFAFGLLRKETSS